MGNDSSKQQSLFDDYSQLCKSLSVALDQLKTVAPQLCPGNIIDQSRLLCSKIMELDLLWQTHKPYNDSTIVKLSIPKSCIYENFYKNCKFCNIHISSYNEYVNHCISTDHLNKTLDLSSFLTQTGQLRNGKYHCTACNLDIDISDLKTHLCAKILDSDIEYLNQLVETLKPIKPKDNCPRSKHTENINVSCDQFMINIQKKHLEDNISDDSYAFYCKPCSMATEQEDIWDEHLLNFHNMNLVKYDHKCSTCRVVLKGISKTEHENNTSHILILNCCDQIGSSDYSILSDGSGTHKQENLYAVKILGLKQNTTAHIIKCVLKTIVEQVNHVEVHEGSSKAMVYVRKREDVQRLINQRYCQIYGARVKFVEETPETPYEPCGTMLFSGINTEVSKVMFEMEKNLCTSKVILDDLNHILSYLDCKMYLYGSRITGLALADSNCNILLRVDATSESTLLLAVKENIDKSSYFNTLTKQINPRTRLLVCKHYSDTRCLLFINSRSTCVQATYLIKAYIRLNERVKWLLIAVRLLMKKANLLGKGMFDMNCLTWLVLFFLMQSNTYMIPPVSSLAQINSDDPTSEWWFKGSKCDINSDDISEETLSNFFRYYASLDYEAIVLCPYTGTVSKKIYNSSTRNNFHSSVLSIKDPLDQNYNISKFVEREGLAKFQDFCKSFK